MPEPASPSAFPELPTNPDELPAIPGGWRCEEIVVGARTFLLQRPTNPDAFLDEDSVSAANQQNDYMPYWAFLWPSAITMARVILQSAPWPAGASVLEVGAGIGLVGLAALARGDAVTFSDYDFTALHLCRLNARLNSLPEPALLQLDWRTPGTDTFDVILGCEVTYDAPTHGDLLRVIHQQLSPNGICWLGDPGRFQGAAFHRAALQAGFAVRILDEHGTGLAKPSSQGFQIFELRHPHAPTSVAH